MSAIEVVKNSPQLVSKLQEINNNPSYYSNYFLVELGFTKTKKGDTHSEQNHSSVVAYLGKGGCMSLCEYISELLKRIQDRARSKNFEKSKCLVSIHRYESKCSDHNDRIMDAHAKKTLSNYAYREFYTKQRKDGSHLQYRTFNEDHDTAVWSANIPNYQDDSKRVIIKMGGRCFCNHRRSFRIQCKHELCYYRKFFPSYYHHSWYNEDYYGKHVSSLTFKQGLYEQEIPSKQEIKAAILDGAEMMFVEEDSGDDINFSLSNIPSGDKISYTECMGKVSTLLKMIQNDKKKINNLYMLIGDITNEYSRGHQLTINLQVHEDNDRTLINRLGSAVGQTVQINTGSKRKQSSTHRTSSNIRFPQSSSDAFSFSLESTDACHNDPSTQGKKTN